MPGSSPVSVPIKACPYQPGSMPSCPTFKLFSGVNDDGPPCRYSFIDRRAGYVQIHCARRDDARVLRALVVDDSPEMCELLELRLHLEGVQVITAENGADALSLLPRIDADVVIIDWKMPVLDGVGFCQMVRSDSAYAATPIVMFSGESPQRAAAALGTLTNVTYVQKGGALTWVGEAVARLERGHPPSDRARDSP